MKAMIVCLLTAIYYAMVRIPTTSNTSSDNGYVHSLVGLLRGLLTHAIWYAARIWKPPSRFIAVGVRFHVSLPKSSTTCTVVL